MQPQPEAAEAGVIVPVYRAADGEVRVVLVRRSERGIHGGQIAFPGGKREPEDKSVLEAALREVWEEIGVKPDQIEILEALPKTETLTTRYSVAPFLGKMAQAGSWKLAADEVVEIFEPPVRDFAAPEARGRRLQHFSNWPEPREVPFFRLGQHRIWGLTYRILDGLVPRLLAGEWKV
jgi:8-oxo-dGTP pyrophosphatase MutT (NUDIX family)